MQTSPGRASAGNVGLWATGVAGAAADSATGLGLVGGVGLNTPCTARGEHQGAIPCCVRHELVPCRVLTPSRKGSRPRRRGFPAANRHESRAGCAHLKNVCGSGSAHRSS